MTVQTRSTVTPSSRRITSVDRLEGAVRTDRNPSPFPEAPQVRCTTPLTTARAPGGTADVVDVEAVVDVEVDGGTVLVDDVDATEVDADVAAEAGTSVVSLPARESPANVCRNAKKTSPTATTSATHPSAIIAPVGTRGPAGDGNVGLDPPDGVETVPQSPWFDIDRLHQPLDPGGERTTTLAVPSVAGTR